MASDWRRGDPSLRRLRLLAAGVFLVLVCVLVLNGREDDTVALGECLGALLVLLGLPGALRFFAPEEPAPKPKPRRKEVES